MKKKFFNAILVSICICISILQSCHKEKEGQNTVMDADGNIYNEVYIGDQTWMNGNLKTTKYNDGSPILNLINKTSWIHDTIGAYCWYIDDLKNRDPRGAIYNFNAVKTGKLCPCGWHVATDDDWNQLEQNIRNDLIPPDTNVVDRILSKYGWEFYGDNVNATDDYSFSAIPNAFRGYEGTFVYSGRHSWWWTSTENENNLVIVRLLLTRTYSEKESGYAVRCIKD